jgi:very-short-patch-repair endonuclease
MKRWTVEIEYAREQRKNATKEEKIMWDLLRDRKFNNLKFYRQYPIVVSYYDIRKEFYIADFYCHTIRLILEIDGEIHNKQAAYDQARDNTLNELGYHILRISNLQVSSQNEDLLNFISSFIDKLKPFFKYP